MAHKLKVTLVRSTIDRPQTQKATVRGSVCVGSTTPWCSKIQTPSAA